MKILMHTRTAAEMDWQREVIALPHLPRVGEYVSIGGQDESRFHRVKLVAHAANASDCEAIIYCERLGPIESKRLTWSVTSSTDVENADQSSIRSRLHDLFTIEQAAEHVQVSTKTIRRLIESGRLAAVDFGTGSKRQDWRIVPEALASVKPVAIPVPPPPIVLPHRRRRRSALTADRSHFPSASALTKI